MRLVHFDLTEAILDETSNFTEWILESPEIFSEYVQELNNQIAGEEGRFVLSENEKELDLEKKAELIINPFGVDVNSRKILNKLYTELSELSKTEQMYTKTVELFQNMQEYMFELEQCTDYILEFDHDLDMIALLKAMNIRYENKEVNQLERLIQYIKILSSAAGIRLFIFVNIRSYLSEEQMQEIVKELCYQEVHALFIENQQRSCMKGGRQYIIDKDRCEIF